MASHSVIERRLRPIYDCIDVGNNKKALQEADKVLKKHPGTACARVLKALAMIRMDRMQEAWTLLDEAEISTQDGALDDHTLTAFTHCYREACVPERIVTIYERQCAIAPTESHLAHLFMAHVRVRQYKHQQQVAMRLFKETGSATSPYYFWAVMSIVMQAIENPSMGEKMLYPLAEKMIEKQIKEKGYSAGPEVELMAIVLEALGKFEEAVQLLEEGPTSKLIAAPKQFLAARCARLLQKAGEHQRAQTRAANVILINVDDWTFWTILFDSTMALLKNAPEEEHESHLKVAVDIVRKEYERSSGFRGPAMARLELIKRLKDAKLEHYISQFQLIGDGIPHLMVSYVREFHTKPCCFADVYPYLWLMTFEEQKEFLGALSDFEREKVTGAGETASDSECWALIACERFRRALVTDPCDRMLVRVTVSRLVIAMLRCEHNDLAAAALAQLAVAHIWDVFEQDDRQMLYEMILLLESVSNRHKPDPLSKLVLCRLYAHLGCAHRVLTLVRALDVKAVQRDTMGYILHPLPELCGRYKVAMCHYTELTTMFDQADREITECLVSAYKQGAFSQVPDLVILCSRVQSSAYSSGSDVMNRWMSALFGSLTVAQAIDTLHGDDEPIDWVALDDNRDLNVIPVLRPGELANQEIDDIREDSFVEMLDMFRLRDLLMRSAASIGRRHEDVPTVRRKLDELEKLLIKLGRDYLKDEQPSLLVQAPTAIQMAHFVHGGFLGFMMAMLRSCVSFVETNDLSKMLTDEQITKCIDDCLPSPIMEKEPLSMHPVIFRCSRALQAIVFAKVVLLALLYRLGEESFRGDSDHSAKGGKGKKTKPRSEAAQKIDSLLTMLVDGSIRLEKVLDSARSSLHEDHLIPEIGTDWPQDIEIFLKEHRSTVDSHIYKNYGAAIDDMLGYIEDGFKF